MKVSSKTVSGVLAGCAMLILILDTKTALSGANEAISLCIHTVVPSLFPFFVLSGIINSVLTGENLKTLRFLGRICRVPVGGESLLLLGFLAGYPVGAQMISEAYKSGSISLHSARRLLGFCSNAGPAFIFGMVAQLFTKPAIPWLLWGVHILSALIVGFIIPSDPLQICNTRKSLPLSLPQSLQKALKSTATVCGWVVIFRIVIAFCGRWFLWRFPVAIQVLLSGLLELTNGCTSLQELPCEGLRFIMASGFLGFGGLCVVMQTTSVTQEIGLGYYFPGKVLQCLISAVLSVVIQNFIFRSQDRAQIPPLLIGVVLVCIVLCVYQLRRKKVVAFGATMLYNTCSNP